MRGTRHAAGSKLPGLFLCLVIALVAYACGRIVPLVGGPVFGIVIGMLVALLWKPATAFSPGVKYASKQLLQLSIIVLGANLSLQQIVGSGMRSLPVMLGTLAITLAVAYVVGRMLGLDTNLRRLLGVGTAICGGSAIAALSTVVEASEAEIAYGISTIFFFNIVAVLTFPPIGHLLMLSQQAFGLWAGTAINDTSSVVAAGWVYGHAAANEAVIVKLTRTTLIVPIVIFYAAKTIAALRTTRGVIDWKAIMPWFILWFLFAALLNTFGVIPAAAHPGLTQLALFLIVLALSGVGLSADFAKMRAAGLRPLALGFVLWVTIAASSLLIARAAHAG